MKTLFFVLLLFPLMIIGQTKKVLVLHSYHQGLRWTDDLSHGIEDALDNYPKLELDFQYLDTKRNTSQAYLQKQLELFKLKEQLHRDLLLVCDNNALQFALNNRSELFPNTPIVFCGVNHYKRNMIMGHSNITGVAETTDLLENIELMKTIHPELEKISVVVDNKTSTSIMNRKEMSHIVDIFTSLEFDFIEDVSLQELKELAARTKEHEVFFLLTFNRDKQGNFVSYETVAEIMGSTSKVPVYTAWDFSLGSGVLGGKLTSGYQQGKIAGEIALDILKGKSTQSIPVVYGNINEYKFDYNAVKRFGISEKELPLEAVYINKTPSFLTQYKDWILLAVLLLLLFTTVVFALIRSYLRNKNFQNQLFEEQIKLNETLGEAQLVAEVAYGLNQVGDWVKLLQKSLDHLFEHLQIDEIRIFSFEQNKVKTLLLKSISESSDEEFVLVGKKDLAVLKRIIAMINDTEEVISEDLSELEVVEQQYFQRQRINAFVLLPIAMSDQVEGMIYFAKKQPFCWPIPTTNILITISHLVASAWEKDKQMKQRARVEQVQGEAIRMAKETAQLSTLGTMVSSMNKDLQKPLLEVEQALEGQREWMHMYGKTVEPIDKGIRTIEGACVHIREIAERMLKFWIDKQQNL